MSSDSRDRFQILSLDGGGLKGAFTACFLAHLQADARVNITDHFDMIVGTSTGGIIALGLGLGLAPREIVRFYQEKGPKIFSKHPWVSSPYQRAKKYFRSKYRAEELKEALRECFSDRTLAESHKRLVIPSYELDADIPYLFKTPHHPRLNRDYKVEAWKVAMATAAAPTYLPAFRGIDGQRLIDGGVWANNPIMLGVTEAISMLGCSLGSISILSIGTTDALELRGDQLDKGGLWTWRTAALCVAFSGQSKGALNQASHLVGKDNVMRISPTVQDGLLTLDGAHFGRLGSFAATHSRAALPLIEEKFFRHHAPAYTPHHHQALSVEPTPL